MIEAVDAIHSIAYALIRQYPQLFHHINYDSIRFEYYAADTGPPIRIEGLNSNAIKLVNENSITERYTFFINKTKLALFNPIAIEWLVLEALLYIHQQCDGKVNTPEFRSFKPIVEAISKYNLGYDYIHSDGLPSLLNESLPIF